MQKKYKTKEKFGTYKILNNKPVTECPEELKQWLRDNIYNNKEIKKNLAIGRLFLQGEDLLLKLTSGVLTLEEVRLEGKKTMIASDFVKGHQVIKINSVNK